MAVVPVAGADALGISGADCEGLPLATGGCHHRDKFVAPEAAVVTDAGRSHLELLGELTNGDQALPVHGVTAYRRVASANRLRMRVADSHRQAPARPGRRPG